MSLCYACSCKGLAFGVVPLWCEIGVLRGRGGLGDKSACAKKPVCTLNYIIDDVFEHLCITMYLTDCHVMSILLDQYSKSTQCMTSSQL